MSNFGGTTINIMQFMVQETGTFHNVYNRGWDLSLDEQGVESIRKRLMGAGRNAPFTHTSFKGIGAGILAPVADVEERDRIVIPEGWGSARYRFMMEVEVHSSLGGTDTYFVQGFSERMDSTYMGTIDPDMRWFINGFIRVQYVEQNTRRGTERHGVVKSSAQIISGRLIYDKDVQVHKTRTVDVFSSIQERFYQAGYAETVEDARTRVTGPRDSIIAHRTDNLPGQFLSSALNTYRRNLDTAHFGTNNEDVMARTQQELNSNLLDLEDNPFLKALARAQGQTQTTEFTINDLIDIDRGVARKGFITGSELSREALGQLAHNGSDVSDWRGADRECTWAVQIANSFSAIMMSHYHRGFSATMTNQNQDIRSVVAPRDATGFAKGLPRSTFDSMLNALEDFMDDISGDGRDRYSLDIHANLYDQTEIFLSLNGGYERRFFIPSFADGLTTQFYTRDRLLLGNLSTDIERLTEDLGSEMNGSAFDVIQGV